MTTYSQRNPLWSWKKLGKTNLTLGSYGCLVTCFGMLANKRPDVVNELFKNNAGLTSGGLVVWDKASQLLGLSWKGKSVRPLAYPTIAEVRMNGIQHFVIWLGNNQIIDPWDGRQKINPYYVKQFCNVTTPVYVAPIKTQPATFWVRVDKDQAAVRAGASTTYPLAGSQILRRGDKFECVGTVIGQSVLGNNVWYKSKKGNYVWSGGITRI